MDEVVTHAEVLRWLPPHVVEALALAMPPDQRGWFTAAEVEDQPDGRFVEVQSLSEREPRYYATGGVIRTPFLPAITDLSAPTRAELAAGITQD